MGMNVAQSSLPGCPSHALRWFSPSCLVAFGWIRGDGLQGAVSVHSMLTQKLYWTYETQVNTQLQELPSGVAMHLVSVN